MITRLILLSLLVGGLAAGCDVATPATGGPGGTQDGNTLPAEPVFLTPESTKPAPASNLDPGTLGLAEDVVLHFTRQGGLSGVDEAWTLYRDGRLVSKDGTFFQVTTAQVDTLLADLERLGLFNVSAPAGLTAGCCDGYLYSLAVQRAERVVQVQAADGLENIPHAVWDAINKVQEFIVAVEMNA